MLHARQPQLQVLLLTAVLAAGCVSPAPKPPAAPSVTVESTETNTDSARPVSQQVEGVEPTPPLLQMGGGQIRAVSLDVQEITVAPAHVDASASGFSPPTPSIRVTDIPGPAGPGRPGSRGIGFPAPDVETPAAPESAIAAGPRPAQAPGALTPALGQSFDSTFFETNQSLTGFLFVPPDAHAAAGPSHVLTVSNVVFQIHDKTGTSLCTIALADFFSGLPTTTELFDPKILYDQFAERWIVVALELTGSTSSILVAVSDDADPTTAGLPCGTWYQIQIDGKVNVTGTDHWTDYPGFAVNEEAVYITGNLFSFSPFGFYGGTRLWIVDKFGGAGGGFYGAGTAQVSTPLDPYACMDCYPTTTQPAHVFGTVPTGVGTYLVSYSGLTEDFESGTDEFVQIVRVDNPLGAVAFVQELVNVGNLEALLGAGNLPDAPQLGTGTLLEVNDRRALAAVWRNDQLYLTADIKPKSGDSDAGETTAHWWRLDTTTPSNGTGAPETVLLDQGSIGGEDIATGTHTFFPSIAVNSTDEIAVGFSASAPTIYGGSYVAVRRPAEPAGTVGPPSTLRAGDDYYVRTFGLPENRWGDYSSVALDPTDDCFWVFNQHALARGTPNGGDGRWGTAAGLICASCMPSKTLTAAVTTDESHRADAITVTGTADVTSGATLQLEFGDFVAFHDGFMVETSSTLAVVGGVCAPN